MKINLEMVIDNAELAIQGVHLEGDFSPEHLRIVHEGVQRIIDGRHAAIAARGQRPG